MGKGRDTGLKDESVRRLRGGRVRSRNEGKRGYRRSSCRSTLRLLESVSFLEEVTVMKRNGIRFDDRRSRVSLPRFAVGLSIYRTRRQSSAQSRLAIRRRCAGCAEASPRHVRVGHGTRIRDGTRRPLSNPFHSSPIAAFLRLRKNGSEVWAEKSPAFLDTCARASACTLLHAFLGRYRFRTSRLRLLSDEDR